MIKVSKPAATVELFLGLDEVDRDGSLLVDITDRASRKAKLPPADVTRAQVTRRSLDTRRGRTPRHRVLVNLWTQEGPADALARPKHDRLRGQRAVVVGSGPAGTFAALRLAEAGAHVTVVERGKAVQPRRHDLAQLVRRGDLDPDSNYCFGEGGAGTFSDGKLYTRVKPRDAVDEVLSILVEAGADPAIRVNHRPHVGSNRLPQILQGMRAGLENLGVRYAFGAALEGFSLNDGRVVAARLRSGEELPCDRVVLATGHSARDTYAWLVDAGVAVERKPFAIGSRVEHPQPLVDEIQYGAHASHPHLPAAFYELSTQAEDRGVYSFCMCPGGWVVDSATEPGHLATNGMSLKRRDSPYANAALVVTVRPEDLAPWERFEGDPLAGIALQRAIESATFAAGGGGFVAPAQRLVDLHASRPSSTALRSSYRPGVTAGDVADCLPDFLVKSLRAAIPRFEASMRGFLSEDAQLVGVETRTSSPLRILRDAATCESPSHQGLYPCGEGAGYAGGIVSAAIDGLRVADAIIARS